MEQKTGIWHHREEPASWGLQGSLSENGEDGAQPPPGWEKQKQIQKHLLRKKLYISFTT